MIRRSFQEHCNASAQLNDVFELKARELTHDPGVWVRVRIERREWAAHIASDEDLPPGRTHHLAQKLACRGLAVRARNTCDGLGQNSSPQLDFAPHGDSSLSRARDKLITRGNTRTFHDDSYTLQGLGTDPDTESDFDASLLKPSCFTRGLGVDRDDLAALAAKRKCCRAARSRKTDHQRPRQAEWFAAGHYSAKFSK